MVKKYKRVNEGSSIGSSYEPELVNRLSSYSELIGVDRTKIVSSLIAEALEGRILDNDFIALDRPYYFDFKKLIHEGKTEASVEPLVIEPERLFILKKVPNNLDRPNKKYGTYSYSEDKPNFHKGLLYFPIVQMNIDYNNLNLEDIAENGYYEAFSFDNASIIDFYFLFEFEQESNKITIHSIEEENLIYAIDPLVYADFYEDLKKKEDEFIINLRLPNGNVNIASVFDSTDVMISYKLYKDTELDLATDTDEKAKVTYLKGYSEFNEFLNK